MHRQINISLSFLGIGSCTSNSMGGSGISASIPNISFAMRRDSGSGRFFAGACALPFSEKSSAMPIYTRTDRCEDVRIRGYERTSMKKTLVANFNGLTCSRCGKPLDNEKQIVDSSNLVGRYLCLPCFYGRQKETLLANRNLF